MTKSLHIKTPLVYSSPLSRKAGCHVYLKLENTQPSGSFKNRGIGALAVRSFETYGPSAHLVCSSGGNAGLACAYAAFSLGVECTIFVPTSTKPEVIKRIEGYGAKVIQGGQHWFEADLQARKLVEKEKEAVYVPPFEHPLVVKGHATIIKEIADQLKEQGSTEAAGLICSVGGGGLLAGLLEGMQNSGGILDVPVIACETAGAASLRASAQASFEAKPPAVKQIPLPAITTIASTLGATMVSRQAVESVLAHKPGVPSVVFEDERAVSCMRSFIDDHAFFVEPACAAALVPIYDPRVLRAALPDGKFGAAGETPPADASSIVVIVCGGNTATLNLFNLWESAFEGKPPGPVSIFDGQRGIDVVLDGNE
ncbi:tryptophan synthase beta subunit-like PLP-dependent enzyme [Meredithblackwellia eburnea MCA 4105]